MARQLSAAFLEALEAKEGRDPFVWLLDVEVPTDPRTVFRLTSSTISVDFGQDSTGTALTYSPAGFTFNGLQESGDGSLPQVEVTIANASQFARQILEDHDGLTDQPVTLRIVNLGLLGGAEVSAEWRGRVGEPTVTTEGITLPLAAPNLTEMPFPGRRDLHDSCAVRKFGSGPCPYPVGQGGALYSSCPRTLAACEARGTDMVTLGFPALLPKQFGGMRGLGREN